MCHLHRGATCNYGFKGHVLKYHKLFFLKDAHVPFNGVKLHHSADSPPPRFFFSQAVHSDACLAVTLRRRITRHTDRAVSCRDGENSSHINPPPDYLVTVPARRTIRAFEETSSSITSNLYNQVEEKRRGKMIELWLHVRRTSGSALVNNKLIMIICENVYPQKCVRQPNKPSSCREERRSDWEGRTVASCFIWAQLDLIFKWRTEAESADAVTMATELMGHTHSKVNDQTGGTAVAPLDGRHLSSAAGLIHLEELPQREGREI